MEIEFIGTGHIGATELCASTLIDDELLVDIGNGIVKRLEQSGHKIENIKNCFITHLHGDHFGDIPFLMLYKVMNKIQTLTCIYGPEGIEERVGQLFELLFPGDWERVQGLANVKFIEVKENQSIKIEPETTITVLEVEHGDCKPAYGYIVEKNNKKLGFSGDSIYCESISQMIKQSDLSVLDMSFVDARKNHMGLEDILNIMEIYPNKKIATTHMKEEAREEAKKKKIENLMIPDDGETIHL